MQSLPGELSYTSEGAADVCGLYLIGLPNQIVEIEFLDFNVNCDTEGLLAVSIRLPNQIVEIEFLDFNVNCDTEGLLAVSIR